MKKLVRPASFALVLALAGSAVAAPAAPSTARPAHCRTTLTYTAGKARSTQPQRLGELPPASLYLAVVRHVGGCPVPAVVRTGIGREGRVSP